MSTTRSAERALSLTPEEAESYAAHVVPRYSALFGRMLIGEIPKRDRLQVLDVGCGTGYPALDVLARLGPSGRVIAMDPDPTLVDVARRRALDASGRRIFFKADHAENLSFGNEVFDVVIGNLVLPSFSQPEVALTEIHRVLAEGGLLLLTHALEGSFEEVLDMFREIALRHDDRPLALRVERVASRYPTEKTFEALFRSAGFEPVEIRTDEFQLTFDSADAVFSDPALHFVAMPEWRWIAGSEEGSETVLSEVRSTLDTYFGGGPLSLRVKAGLAIAHA